MQQVLEFDMQAGDGKPFNIADEVAKLGDFAKSQLVKNSSAIATLISSQIEGLDPSIIDLIIGIITSNDEAIRKSASSLAAYLYLDPEIVQSFIQLGMCQINKDDKDYEKSKGFIISAVKHLFRTLLHMNEDIQLNIGKICDVAIDGNP